MGRPQVFGGALALCIVWLVVGPRLDHEVTGPALLLFNVPTLFTLLMVFLVQHTQNHHNDAVQAKLDELIRAAKGAHNDMVHVEELSPDELERIRAKYQALADRVRSSPGGANSSINTPDVESTPGPLIVLGPAEREPRG